MDRKATHGRALGQDGRCSLGTSGRPAPGRWPREHHYYDDGSSETEATPRVKEVIMDLETTPTKAAWLVLALLFCSACSGRLELVSPEPPPVHAVEDENLRVIAEYRGLVRLVHSGERPDRAMVLIPVADGRAPGDLATTPHRARLVLVGGCQPEEGWEAVRRCTGSGRQTETRVGLDLTDRQLSFPSTQEELNLVFDGDHGLHHLADMEPLVSYVNRSRSGGNRLGPVFPNAGDENSWPTTGSLAGRVLLDGGDVYTSEYWRRRDGRPIRFVRTDNSTVGHERGSLAAGFDARFQMSERKIEVSRVDADGNVQHEKWLGFEGGCDQVRLRIENAPSAGTPESPDERFCQVADYHFAAHYRLQENWKNLPDNAGLLVPEERGSILGPLFNNAQCSPVRSDVSDG